MSHTPGPWHVESICHQWDVWSGIEIELGGRGETLIVECDKEADARLIAAAPDLLAACEALMDLHDGRSVRAIVMARAAIAKARGGKS